jgi:uroporphyrin-III C-methyltransferase/precorrin-2 dehydrogenase/sirohydrochlorin ferrochelatase
VPAPYVVGLRLDGRRVVVVGGGSVAQRRLPALLAAGARVQLIAPEITPAVEAMVGGGELIWQPRRYAGGDLDGAWYVLALTDDSATNAAVAADADAAGVFCARADDASGGTAVTPATGEQGGLQVGIVSSEAFVPGGRDSRRVAAVRDGIVEALREGRLDSVPRRVGAGVGTGPGTVALVGGGPGDPDLITVRGRRLLAHADVVVADRLAPRSLLEELGAHVEVVDATKLPRGRAMPQQAINEELLRHARAGKFVVRLKGGDPFVFGRGWEEVEACAAAGVPVTVVPGLSSAIAVPALVGIPLTRRGIAHEAVIVSGHVPPDDPQSMVDWSALARLRGTIVVLMGMDNLALIAAALVRDGRAGSTPAAVIQDGTMPTEQVATATLDTIADVAAQAGLRPPAIVVIGAVATARNS